MARLVRYMNPIENYEDANLSGTRDHSSECILTIVADGEQFLNRQDMDHNGIILIDGDSWKNIETFDPFEMAEHYPYKTYDRFITKN